MKDLPVLMCRSMLTCLASVPVGCLCASLITTPMFHDEADLRAVLEIWMLSSVFGFPIACWYGAPLYALCVRFYRPTWWLVLLFGGGPFWVWALQDLMAGLSGSVSLLLLIYGLAVAASHHLLMTFWWLPDAAGSAGSSRPGPR